VNKLRGQNVALQEGLGVFKLRIRVMIRRSNTFRNLLQNQSSTGGIHYARWYGGYISEPR
jgi:hypothetical protein